MTRRKPVPVRSATLPQGSRGTAPKGGRGRDALICVALFAVTLAIYFQTAGFDFINVDDPAYAVAVKQIYASHYFETALDLTVCVRDQESPDRGFYLITLKGSQQAGLTGLKGSIVRKVAVDKTRSSLERALASIKQKLESQTQ